MAGRRTEWRLLQYVGVVAFAIGLVGYIAFGWRFDGTSEQLPAALAVVAAAVALVWTLARNR